MKFAMPFTPVADRSPSASFPIAARQSHGWGLPRLGGETKDLQTLFARVVGAYSRGSLANVRDLVAPPLLKRLIEEVAERHRLKHELSSRLVEFISAEVVDREDRLLGGWVDVRFVSRMVVALRGPDGTVLAGDPVEARMLSEVWTLQRSRTGGESGWLVTAMVEDE